MFNTILVIFPIEKRGAAMGLIGLVIMFAPASGPSISGLILANLSWHWIFWISLPFFIISLVCGLLFLPNISKLTKPKIDVLSIVLSTLGFGGIVIRQLRMKQPMMDLRAFKYPMFTVGLILIFLCMMMMLSSMLILPMYLQQGMAVTALTAGLVLLPGSLLNGFLSPVMGRLFDKFGPKWLVIIGLAIVTIVLFMYTGITPTTTLGKIITLHVFMMIGISMIMMPAQTNGLNQLPPDFYPHGTAIMNTLQQVSGAIGTAVAVSILSAGQTSFLRGVTNPESPENQLAGFTSGVQNAFVFALVLAVIGLITSLFVKRVKVGAQQEQQSSMH
ncbi:hypothetical protein G195_000372 [Phytophthora kernoviae 00238/432]|uniref:Major facilitator superfamily (MFS) profile domain-containing protein n=1 Tax=Phytophthora kernoviae 00238/432 TaxID=1284355 RepID=A0A8J4WKH4_9STRA|nr:hypothetical protein G195_000372 [Phytophthora kernoviae 00238/432]